MTLAGLERLTCLQLGEEADDLGQEMDLIRRHLNDAYRICRQEYLRPVRKTPLVTDAFGRAALPDDVRAVRRVEDDAGHRLPFRLQAGAGSIALRGVRRAMEVTAYCETETPPLVLPTDEPELPPEAQAALCDHACARWLENGSPAEQQRALRYERRFAEVMRRIRPQQMGVSDRLHGLYAASALR